MSTSEIAAKTGQALAMLSKTYFFEMIKPIHESLRVLGSCRVVSVVVDEADIPALGLRSPDDELIHFYSIDELRVVDVVQSAA